MLLCWNIYHVIVERYIIEQLVVIRFEWNCDKARGELSIHLSWGMKWVNLIIFVTEIFADSIISPSLFVIFFLIFTCRDFSCVFFKYFTTKNSLLKFQNSEPVTEIFTPISKNHKNYLSLFHSKTENSPLSFIEILI